MAAPEGNQNAVGNTGGGSKPYTDRRKMAQLRGLVLDKAIEMMQQPIVKMSQEDYEFYKEVMLKLTGSILPRLQEVSGTDGEVLQISFDKAFKQALTEKENATTSVPAPSGDQPSPIQGSAGGAPKREDNA